MRSLLSRFEPAPRRVLLLDATGMAVFERQGSELVRLADFEPHADGYEAFRDFLSTQGADPVYLLVDTVAEDFITDVIAHVGINDRQALLRRKLDQHFRGLEYRQVMVVGRETTGRKDDRILVSALSKNQQIDPWIRCLLQEEVPLRGVASTAHVMSQVIASHALPSGQVLVVNWETGGIRQTYVQGGRTLFSRLSPPAPQDEQSHLADHIMGLCRQSREYLERSRLLAFETPLDVVVLSPWDIDERLHAFGNRDGFGMVIRQEPAALADFRSTSEVADLITANLLCVALAFRRDRVWNVYAPPVAKRYYHLKQLRQAIYAGTVALLMVGLAVIRPVLAEALVHRAGYQDALRRTQPLEQQYAELTEGFPATPIPSLPMELAVTTYERLSREAVDPSDTLVALSQVFAAFPSVTVTQVNWSLQPQDVDSTIVDALINETADISVDIRGEFATTTGFLDTDRELRDLVAALERLDGLEVTPLLLPIETSTAASVSATIGERAATAPFILNVRQPVIP